MSFVRPEVVEALVRWREALLGLLLFLCGGWFVLTGYGLYGIGGWIAVAIGALLVWEGVLRARFPRQGGGPGVVDIDERQITWFGPTGGGSVSLDALRLIAIRRTRAGSATSDFFWEFEDTDGNSLSVPGDAENADALFDAFAALPGVDYEAIIAASARPDEGLAIVWHRPSGRLH